MSQLEQTATPEMPDELRPRHLVVRIAQVAAVIGVVALAIMALPGLDQVREQLADADSIWIAAIVVAEFASCLGYVLVFRATFCSGMSWRLSYDIAMAELAANSLLPAGGAGGLALGVWALRQAGMPTGHIARRTVAFFVVTSAANFACVVVVGLGVWLGLIPGNRSAVLTFVPAAAAALAAVVVAVSPRLLRAVGGRGNPAGENGGWNGHVKSATRAGLAAAADGVEQALSLLRTRSAGVVVGSLAYVAFDIAALGFGFAAVGSVPPLGTLVLGYLLGQLGNLIPLPGGIGGTEGALIGVFVLYGVGFADASAAVLAYRLVQLVLPALLGAPAFVLLRRRLMEAEEPAVVCAPLALETVRLPARSPV